MVTYAAYLQRNGQCRVRLCMQASGVAPAIHSRLSNVHVVAFFLYNEF